MYCIDKVESNIQFIKIAARRRSPSCDKAREQNSTGKDVSYYENSRSSR